MLLQNWSHHYRSFMTVIMHSWIVTVYPCAPWKLICSTYHSFPLLFRLPWNWHFMSISADASRTAEDAYPNGTPGPCIQFLVESGLPIWFCCFVRISLVIFLFFVVCVGFLCLVFSLDYTVMNAARILVSLITLTHRETYSGIINNYKNRIDREAK